MKTRRSEPLWVTVVSSLCLAFAANAYILLERHFSAWILILFIISCLAANFLNYFPEKRPEALRLKLCASGVCRLESFFFSTAVSVVFQTVSAVKMIPGEWKSFLWGLFVCVLVNLTAFLNGILCVYFSSVQLGIKKRLLGLIFGWVPIVNIWLLFDIIRTVEKEVVFETEKEDLNKSRKNDLICKTRYPLLFVHGVFFRDFEKLCYWGRIPDELKKNGAEIYYGNHGSASSVAESGKQLAARIKEIAESSGAGKVNIIAHSKGGLDCRYAISNEGAGKYTASLTTINTPHRGCEFADWLLKKVPRKAQFKIAGIYNSALAKIGDENPDFLTAVNDLTSEKCLEFNRENPETEYKDEVFFQSVGSKLEKASGGKFPLNLTYHLAKYFDGANDGLVGEKSFPFGEKYTFLVPSGKRGISHGDMVDLNRENIDGFDVREFYVQLVSDLRKRGL